MSGEILSIEKLNVFCPSATKGSRTNLLDNVNLRIYQDDILGLVGETGAGKSILIDAIGCDPKPPLSVEAKRLSIQFDSESRELLELEEEELSKIWGKVIAFIPPNARDKLNPILKVGKQVENVLLAKLGISREESHRRVVEIFRKVQMPDPERNYYNYPHELSGGMAQRVLISIALSVSPKLLLADEPTMGLDVTIQTQVLDLMVGLLRNLRSGVILATRDLGIVANYCNEVAVLCRGQLVELSEVNDFFRAARHPYSHYLLAAAFAVHGRQVELDLTGKRDLIPEKNHEKGCRFADRCVHVMEVCRSVRPNEDYISERHYVACHAWKDKKLSAVGKR